MWENKKIRSSLGFTTIELMISLLIIALLVGVFLINYNSGQRKIEVVMAAQNLVSNIRLAQNNSLGSVEFDLDHNGQIDAGETVPAGGWGVYFNIALPDSYIIFADINSPNGNSDYDGSIELDKRISFSDDVQLESLNDDFGSLTEAVVTFLPPDPIIYINGLLNNNLTVTLKDMAGNLTKNVLVNFFGLVEATD